MKLHTNPLQIIEEVYKLSNDLVIAHAYHKFVTYVFSNAFWPGCLLYINPNFTYKWLALTTILIGRNKLGKIPRAGMAWDPVALT